MESILTKLVPGQLRTYAAIILMFTYSILLDRDFACTCRDQKFDCELYIGLPGFIIFLLILWTDRSFQRVCRYLCSAELRCRDTGRFWGSFFRKLLKAALVGALWASFVFLDGDWYVCCQNDGSEQQAQLACKDKRKITDEERVIIAELKNYSKRCGGFLLFGIILVASIMPLFGWKKCCGKSSCCNRTVLYDKQILEEEENILVEVFRKSAKEKLTKRVEDKIRDEQLEDCFHVAEELIKARATENQESGGSSHDQQLNKKMLQSLPSVC